MLDFTKLKSFTKIAALILCQGIYFFASLLILLLTFCNFIKQWTLLVLPGLATPSGNGILFPCYCQSLVLRSLVNLFKTNLAVNLPGKGISKFNRLLLVESLWKQRSNWICSTTCFSFILLTVQRYNFGYRTHSPFFWEVSRTLLLIFFKLKQEVTRRALNKKFGFNLTQRIETALFQRFIYLFILFYAGACY